MTVYSAAVADALAAAGVKDTAGDLERWLRKRDLRPELLPNGTDAPAPYVVALVDGAGVRVAAGVGGTLLEGWAAAVADALGQESGGAP